MNVAEKVLPSTEVLHRGKAACMPRGYWRGALLWTLLGAVIIVGIFSLTVGAMDLSVKQVIAILYHKISETGTAVSDIFTKAQEIVVWNIRFTRILLAVIVGCGLGMAGAAMQGVFRNPLADPGIIGVSGGGAIGAIMMIVLGARLLPAEVVQRYSLYAVPVAAMIGAVLMTWLIYSFSLRRGQVDLISMILVGIAINALGAAFIGLLTFIATAEELQTMTFWGLGSLGRANWRLMLPAFVFILLPSLFIPGYARALNALSLGEQDAQHLGINVGRVKRNLIVLSASVVGATVALCGTIGFIALVAPHIVRTAIGPDHRYQMVGAGLLGALLLLLADMGARTVAAPAELPIGILTALFGAPVFLMLIFKRRNAYV